MLTAAIIGAYGLVYLRRALTLRRTGHPVPAWRVACFAGGMVVIGFALSPVLDDKRLTVHMVQHLLLADVASLLVVLGLTGPLLAPLLRVPGAAWLRALGHPVVAFLLWAATLWLWHLPVAYEGAVRHDVVHVAEHACFFLAGVNLWMPLFGPFPKPEWFARSAQLTYVLAARITAAVLANLFVWSDTRFYDTYRDLADQSAAGAVMMVEESVVMVALLGWLLARWIRDAGERQELLELAGAHGVAVDERRVARAVSAGRGQDLRRRLVSPRAPEDRSRGTA